VRRFQYLSVFLFFTVTHIAFHRLTRTQVPYRLTHASSIVSHLKVQHRLTYATSSSHKRKFVELHRLTYVSSSSHRRLTRTQVPYRLTHASSIVSHLKVQHRLTYATCIVSHTLVHRLTDVSSNRIVSQTKVLRTASSHRPKFFELHRLTDASSSSHRRKFFELHRLTDASSSSHRR
jgi:hypothetical protein